MRLLIAVSIALVLVLSGCSGSDDEPTTTTTAEVDDTDADTPEETLGACSDLEGTVEEADATDGCLLEEGVVAPSITYECDDGRKVFQVGDRVGIEDGEWQPVSEDLAPLDLC